MKNLQVLFFSSSYQNYDVNLMWHAGLHGCLTKHGQEWCQKRLRVFSLVKVKTKDYHMILQMIKICIEDTMS